MGRDLPARTVFNGPKTVVNGRDPVTGRFVPGNPGGGRPANPYSRAQASLRLAALEAVHAGDLQAVVRKLLHLARRGDLAATEQLFRWIVGPPPAPTHPDRVDEDELAVRRRLPTLVDWLALADEQADREPAKADPDEALADAEPEELPPAALHPQLRDMLVWAIRELAEAQTREVPQPPPSPQAGWERFAASRLEFAPEAAVDVDMLLLAYMRWCGARGEPVLTEGQVLAWLVDHGATVRTGAVSQVTAVVGVRVVA
jgi:hypothetical protein